MPLFDFAEKMTGMNGKHNFPKKKKGNTLSGRSGSIGNGNRIGDKTM
jgi:hypothetical protein